MVLSPEIALERFINEKRSRREKKYAHFIGRVAVEDLPPDHLYRWLVNWMNQQLSDIGLNSTGGHPLPPLHFDLVRVLNDTAAAHVFETEEFAFIVVTEPMVHEMLMLSQGLVAQNRSFMTLQIAPAASPREVAQLLLFMQFCFVTSHEYSHLARRHLDDHQPLAGEIGESLCQAQELDADGYGIYHDLEYFFRRGEAISAADVEDAKRRAVEELDLIVLPPLTHGSVLCSLGRKDTDRVRFRRGTSATTHAN
jgi:hypothetical protein